MSSKARMVQEPYRDKGLKFKQELESSIDERPAIDKMYTHEKGFKWLINSRGYVHIWVKKAASTKILGDEPIKYYLIIHYRVTVDGNLHELGYSLYSNSEAMEQAFAEI